MPEPEERESQEGEQSGKRVRKGCGRDQVQLTGREWEGQGKGQGKTSRE